MEVDAALDSNDEIIGAHLVGQNVGVDAPRLNEQDADSAGGHHRTCVTVHSDSGV